MTNPDKKEILEEAKKRLADVDMFFGPGVKLKSADVDSVVQAISETQDNELKPSSNSTTNKAPQSKTNPKPKRKTP